MKNEEILKKAIEKVVKSGKLNYGFGKFVEMSLGYQTKVGGSFEEWLILYDVYMAIIFSHNFAKAFWGNGNQWETLSTGRTIKRKNAWKYHLQQLVLEEDPILYLEKYV